MEERGILRGEGSGKEDFRAFCACVRKREGSCERDSGEKRDERGTERGRARGIQ